MKTIGWLMLLSQIMLLLFVAEWMRSQYRVAEKRLDEDLHNIFKKTEEQLTNDTLDKAVAIMLMQYPDTISHHRIEVNMDTTIRMSMHENNIDSSPLPHTLALKNRTLKKPPPDINIRKIDIQTQGTADANALPDALKKVLRITVQQAAGDKGIWGAGLFIPVDSSSFRKAFISKLKEKQLSFGARWNSTSNKDNNLLFVYRRRGENNMMALAVTDYKFYLVKSLLPQAGFSAIVLLLTGIVFLLAYRNMNKQAKFSEQKDSFISNISHELKTPVSTTRVALEALSTYNALEDPIRSRKYLEIATWETKRLETLINRVMNTIMAEDGHLILDKAPLNLATVLYEITGMMQPLVHEKNLQVQPLLEDKNIIVEADKMHLQGAIYNLLDNAIKYGGNQINIHLEANDGYAIINIEDNGPGIPVAYRQKVFDKFFRVPQGNRHDIKGHGLGLSYARYIMKVHGGQLLLGDQQQGATFILTLPLYKI